MGDRQNPTAEGCGVFQAVDIAEGGQESFLGEVFGFVRVAAVEIQAREDQPAGSADKLFKGSPIATAAGGGQ
jgi:hypothetical protein